MTLVKNNSRNLNNIFDEFLSSFPAVLGKETNFYLPPVNVSETNEAYHLELVAPGLKKEDFKVNVEKGLLSISYENKIEVENNNLKTHRKEFSVKSFKRSFNIDDNINSEGIIAKYENGILSLLLPKKEEVKVSPKKINIQ